MFNEEEEDCTKRNEYIDTRLLITRYGGGIFHMRRRDLHTMPLMHARAKIIIYALRTRFIISR